MFHVELRQFPHLARAFNLTQEELQSRFLAPWLAGRALAYDDRRWSPEKTRLTVYEARQLRPDEIGLGRGWANVTRVGKDATERLLAAARTDPALAQLKRELLALGGNGGVDLYEAVRLAGALHPGRRVSEQLSLAEQAVWELLHERGVGLMRAGVQIGPEQWQALLLTWSSWTERGPEAPRLAGL